MALGQVSQCVSTLETGTIRSLIKGDVEAVSHPNRDSKEHFEDGWLQDRRSLARMIDEFLPSINSVANVHRDQVLSVQNPFALMSQPRLSAFEKVAIVNLFEYNLTDDLLGLDTNDIVNTEHHPHWTQAV